MSKPADMSSVFVPFARHDTEQSIVARFCEQAQKYPSRSAIESFEENLTYSELDRRSNRVANVLLEQGNGNMSSTLVALLFGHNASMVIAMLGVLKAGKAYVPLDPRYPAARLKQILENLQSALVLTENAYEGFAAEVLPHAATVINITRISAVAHQTHPEVLIDPGQIAYVLYTSGSTDTPKGVMQSHRNVLRNIRNYTNDIHICPSDRLSLLSSFSFAASVSDLYGGIMNGATVCLFDLQQGSMQSCAQWLQSKKITIYYSVPSVFRLLVSVLNETGDCSFLRVIKLGGDSVTHSDYQLYRNRFSDRCILLVSLGATEINLISRYMVDKDTELPQGIVPVGYPPDGVELILLDAKGEPVPRGNIGELMVRSSHLALGYWNESENRGSRLIQDSHHANQRMFKTGDLGRFLDDGCLIHLGRSDSRVKISGQSVSLREIEAVLAGMPMVRDAVVEARSDHDGNNRLIAYVLGEKGVHPSITDLRHYLRQRLPLYMVPHKFNFVHAFPYTQNGKLDRSSLSHLPIEHPSVSDDILSPSDGQQKRILVIWNEVLGVREIGVHDEFLELGGDSLLAIKVIARIRKEFGVDVPIDTFFDHSTPAGLCVAVDNLKKIDDCGTLS